jgi:hypothetical protein
MQAKDAANWSNRPRHRSDELTKELGNSIDDDLEL